MALIVTHRHRPEDLRAWRRYERTDAIWARSPRLDRAIEQAERIIREFLPGPPAFVGVSWGKDSLVLADIILRIAPDTPLVWTKYIPLYNPDCELVRDRYLAMHPEARYEEIEVDDSVLPPGKDWDDLSWQSLLRIFFREANERYPRRFLGLRADESSGRRWRARCRGAVAGTSCAPLIWWPNHLVFGYIHRYDLPLHPAYGYTLGGTFDRARIRVDDIGDEKGTGVGRAEWERIYYGDIIDAATPPVGLPPGRPADTP